MAVAVLVFAGLGAAVAALAGQLLPARVDLARAVAGYDAAHHANQPHRAGGTGWLAAGLGRLRDRLLAVLDARGLLPGWQQADLDLLGRSPARWTARKALTALYGALLPPAALAVTAALGAQPPVVPPLLASPLLAAALWVLADVDLRRSAAARRRELTHALGCYLDLVAMSLAGGRSVADALPTAAAIGRGWAFALIADTISGARLSGATPWQALGDLGQRVRVPALVDLAAALRLVADDGARIRDSITARAATLRRRQLTDAEGRAGQADQGMLVAQVVLAFGFLLLALYPAAYEILTF